MNNSDELNHCLPSRNIYIDFVKGIAIFLVVFGHCIQFGNGGGFDFFGDSLFRIIYSFHMPLFALVSGYLFLGTVSRNNIPQVFKKLLQSLILPAVSWTLVYRTLLILFSKNASLDINFIREIMRSPFYAFWFLRAMFICSCIVITARYFFRDKYIFYASVLVLSMFCPSGLGLSLDFFVYPYFAAGYLWHRDGFDEKLEALPVRYKFFLGTCVIVLWYFLMKFFTTGAYIYTTGLQIIMRGEKIFSFRHLCIDIFRWLIGFAGSLSVMFLLKLIKPVKFISLIGTKTIGIYIISVYMMFHVVVKILSVKGYAANFLEAVIITGICYFISDIISKNRLLNKIFMGGR